MKHEPAAGRWCVIGAGPAGLAAARALSESAVPFEVLERGHAVGGLWRQGTAYSPMYDSTRMISSKRNCAFRGFPMPEEFATFPSRDEAQAYLAAFAEHFDLERHIVFGVDAVAIEARPDYVLVTTGDGSLCCYRGVIVATGHHWSPTVAAVPGAFDGTIIHSSSYRNTEPFVGRRVLVVGAGNSGCDIAAEVSRVASVTFHSCRRSPDLLPKFIVGRPTDELIDTMHRWHVPRAVQAGLRRLVRSVVNGDITRHHRTLGARPGSSTPRRRLVLNQDLAACIHNGTVRLRPPLVRLDGDRVGFADGTSENVDAVILATGYNITVPKLAHWEAQEAAIHSLIDLIFDPRSDRLFFLGLIQPDGGAWPIFEEQAQLVVSYIRALLDRPDVAARFWSRLTADRTAHTRRRSGRLEGALRVDRARYRRHLRLLTATLAG